ncbi:transcriptional regulator, MarR family with acetyltransferase activity [Rhodoferax sp. OV413]|uniref:bifunctional helix-turn-helix transcriptional regulator/GNAT family N-acetyltransferase n=1 Tax=Rhodoferax sp. OV413 TaxID=1855285 RepID=UPI000887F1F5|nr:helix-turn-helix domain-containing GNAT family N-acetyltransferase [Rhodoferax sp. OV413]SDO97139.1 transcriptional regulator, MarR family with acetyltransferase activity [Rhodoferax sp. OV413]
MTDCDPVLVEHVRAASRQMVRELGFMQATLAGTEYPPSAVHAIMEIGARQSLTSAQLAEVLYLEKSSVSRMVRKLIDAGELKETTSTADARAKLLALTAKGKRTLAAIHAFGRQQVIAALAQLPEAKQHIVGQGLATYSQALQAHRIGNPLNPAESIEIQQGYLPGVIGRVTEMHAHFYARSVGFGQFFESMVAAGMAEFAPRLANPCNGLWVAMLAGRIVGSVAIDGEGLGNNTAHLRWFIVGDGMRGTGVGRRLLAEALAFCDRHGFAAVQLWSFQGLNAARRLYESEGFVLNEERAGQQWGIQVVEQRFVRERYAVVT